MYMYCVCAVCLCMLPSSYSDDMRGIHVLFKRIYAVSSTNPKLNPEPSTSLACRQPRKIGSLLHRGGGHYPFLDIIEG